MQALKELDALLKKEDPLLKTFERRPSKLEVNFHWTICGDMEFHECLVSRREGVVWERVAGKDVVTVREESSMASSSTASEGGSSSNWSGSVLSKTAIFPKKQGRKREISNESARGWLLREANV